MINQIKNPTFGGFKPDAMQRIAGTLGYTGDMSGFQQYLEQNPEKRTQMEQFKQAAMMMAKGGAVRGYQVGGNITNPTTPNPITPVPEQPVPVGTTPQPNMLQLGPNVTTPQITEPPKSTIQVEPKVFPTMPIGGVDTPVPQQSTEQPETGLTENIVQEYTMHKQTTHNKG